jgi:hypothetical protein
MDKIHQRKGPKLNTSLGPSDPFFVSLSIPWGWNDSTSWLEWEGTLSPNSWGIGDGTHQQPVDGAGEFGTLSPTNPFYGLIWLNQLGASLLERRPLPKGLTLLETLTSCGWKIPLCKVTSKYTRNFLYIQHLNFNPSKAPLGIPKISSYHFIFLMWSGKGKWDSMPTDLFISLVRM